MQFLLPLSRSRSQTDTAVPYTADHDSHSCSSSCLFHEADRRQTQPSLTQQIATPTRRFSLAEGRLTSSSSSCLSGRPFYESRSQKPSCSSSYRRSPDSTLRQINPCLSGSLWARKADPRLTQQPVLFAVLGRAFSRKPIAKTLMQFLLLPIARLDAQAVPLLPSRRSLSTLPRGPVTSS